MNRVGHHETLSFYIVVTRLDAWLAGLLEGPVNGDDAREAESEARPGVTWMEHGDLSWENREKRMNGL